MWGWVLGGSAAAISLTPFSTLNAPIGIDYDETDDILSGNFLIASFNWGEGIGGNLATVNRNGTNAGFSSLVHFRDELKIATVRTVPGCQKFPVGNIFTENGFQGEIVQINPDGTIVAPAGINPGNPANLSWVTLPDSAPDDLLRGSLFVDRSCDVWGGATSSWSLAPGILPAGERSMW